MYQNRVICTRNTSLHGSQTSPVVLCTKTEWFEPEILISMGPRPHLSFCACKTTWLASESLVSIGPSPYLWVFHEKSDFRTRITSLYGSQTSPIVFCMQNNVISIRITSLYGSQLSSVFFCMQNSDLWIRIKSLYGSQTSPVDLWMQNSVPTSRMTLIYLSQPSSVVLCIQNSSSIKEILVALGPSPHLWFLYAKQRL